MSEELKACPFCGLKVQKVLIVPKEVLMIRCPKCGMWQRTNETLGSCPPEESLIELQQAKEEIKEIQHGFEIQQTAYVNLLEENKKLKNVLASLLNACLIADAEGELYESVTGDLLDKAQEALQ